MKKFIAGLTCILFIGIFSIDAQIKDDAKKTANKVGNKTAEVASKTKSTIVDRVYKDKEGPDGQKIYIDKHDKCYWVDKKGRKQYIAKSRLKDKKE